MLDRFREVLSHPHVTHILLTSLWARLPIAMQSIALLLFLAPHDGYGRAGLALGVLVATGGTSNIAITRLVDRYGPRPVILPAAVAYAAVMAGLALTGSRGYAVHITLCGLAGFVQPPVSSVTRSLYTRLLPADVVHSVFGLEATAQELTYIVGPSGVAVLAGLVGAGEAVAAVGIIGLTGCLAFLASPATKRADKIAVHSRTPVWGTGVISYAVAGVGITACFAIVEVAVVAVVGGKHANASSGFVLSLWSIGSMAGGAYFAARASTVTDRSLATAMLALGGSVAVLSLAPNTLVIALLLLGGGVTIAPCMARLYTRLGAVAPPSAATEAFGWLSAAFLVGASAGSAIAGVCVEHLGGHVTFVLAGLAAVSCVLSIPGLRARPVAASPGR